MAQTRDTALLNNIALRIKSLREARGLTQEQVYNDTDVHIARIETAKVNISVSTLSRLCQYFDLSLADFFASIDQD